jgi:hypothetical protein
MSDHPLTIHAIADVVLAKGCVPTWPWRLSISFSSHPNVGQLERGRTDYLCCQKEFVYSSIWPLGMLLDRTEASQSQTCQNKNKLYHSCAVRPDSIHKSSHLSTSPMHRPSRSKVACRFFRDLDLSVLFIGAVPGIRRLFGVCLVLGVLLLGQVFGLYLELLGSTTFRLPSDQIWSSRRRGSMVVCRLIHGRSAGLNLFRSLCTVSLLNRIVRDFRLWITYSGRRRFLHGIMMTFSLHIFVVGNILLHSPRFMLVLWAHPEACPRAPCSCHSGHHAYPMNRITAGLKKCRGAPQLSRQLCVAVVLFWHVRDGPSRLSVRFF